MGKRARERRAARREARLERKRIKQEGRTTRAMGRQDTKAQAYAQGIDPGAKWTALAGKGLDLIGSKSGKGIDSSKSGNASGDSQSAFMPLIIGAAALFLLKKK